MAIRWHALPGPAALGTAMSFALTACAAGGGTVQVTAQAQARADGGVVYRYTVHNGAAQDVVALAVATPDRQAAARDTSEAPVPPGAPDGWRAARIAHGEMSYVAVEWRAPPGRGIAPGRTEAGFSVTEPRPDPRYLAARWTATLADGSQAAGQLAGR